MTTPSVTRPLGGRRLVRSAAYASAAALLLAACGSSTGAKTAPTAGVTSTTGAPVAATSSAPGTMFSVAPVSGLGSVIVDGNGRTVYLLMAGGKNVTCNDANGCTKFWPDLPLPAGTPTAKAGPGVQAALLATIKSSDGETYPTYNGWLMYEFVQDTAPGQGNGQGIHSFGGTWSALTPAGTPVATPGTSTTY